MKKFICTKCKWIYDPKVGDPKGGVAPGTPFKNLPEDIKNLITTEKIDNYIKLLKETAPIKEFIEKKKYKTARFIGPPPIPRKEERIPKNNPIDKQIAVELTSFVLIRDLFKT